MRILLDTHCFLWFIAGDDQLSKLARATIEDPGNQSLLSMASLWEMAIKISLGKLSFAQPFGILIPDQLERNGIAVLDITLQHTAMVANLPFYHRDPFDRLLIAQAQVEGVSIVSGDAQFDSYQIARIW